jgi:hypothetical protein
VSNTVQFASEFDVVPIIRAYWDDGELILVARYHSCDGTGPGADASVNVANGWNSESERRCNAWRDAVADDQARCYHISLE